MKVNCIILLVENLNTKEALVSRRMCTMFIDHNEIDCEVLTGTAHKNITLIPLINVTFSGKAFYLLKK